MNNVLWSVALKNSVAIICWAFWHGTLINGGLPCLGHCSCLLFRGRIKMREKLIEILRVPIYPHELADPTEVVADYLLDNDVVPVVRCKDCKFAPVHPTDSQKLVCTKSVNWRAVEQNHFCSYGERRTQ